VQEEARCIAGARHDAATFAGPVYHNLYILYPSFAGARYNTASEIGWVIPAI